MLFPTVTIIGFLACSFGGVGAADWPFDVTTLTAPDGSITAKFVSFGSTLTEVWVPDRNGNTRDVIIGYDDNTKLLTDPTHPVFNPVTGRYSGRIKNGTFSIPITKYPQEDGPNVYHTALNDHDGRQTIHGGLYGWDRRNWTIVEKTSTSVTYTHFDPADEGFPGDVTVFARHSVANRSVLHSDVWAYATERTPIMVTQHIYWNLDAYQDNSTDVLNHYLRIDGDQVIEIDGDSIPTGDFIDVEDDPVFDFRDGRLIGEDWDATKDLCGTGCYGFDHSWVYTGANTSAFPGKNEIKTSLWSNLSGIRLDISSDQPNVHVFSAYWLGLLMQPRKVVHGGPLLNYTESGAVALEFMGYLDAINTPEWGIDQIYDSERMYSWSTTYAFSTF